MAQQTTLTVGGLPRQVRSFSAKTTLVVTLVVEVAVVALIDQRIDVDALIDQVVAVDVER